MPAKLPAHTMPLPGEEEEIKKQTTDSELRQDTHYALKVHLIRGGRMQSLHFSLGYRFLFCSLPFYLYAAGPIFLMASGVLMVFFLWYVDFNHGLNLIGKRRHHKILNKHVYSGV